MKTLWKIYIIHVPVCAGHEFFESESFGYNFAKSFLSFGNGHNVHEYDGILFN